MYVHSLNINQLIFWWLQDSDEEEQFDIKESVVRGEDGREMIIKHVMLPSQAEIEAMIAERRKDMPREDYEEDGDVAVIE